MKTSMDYELMETYADKADLVVRKTEKLMEASMGTLMGFGDIADLDDTTALLVRDTMDLYRDCLALIRDQASLMQETRDMVKEMYEMVKEQKKYNDEMDEKLKEQYAKELV